MKKTYIAPVMEMNDVVTCQMMALSLQNGAADESEVLSKGKVEWDMWSDED